MFREIRRKVNAISDEEAMELMLHEKRGVLAVNGDDDYPFAFPVDYYYDRDAAKIYFHGAAAGYKVDALKKCDKICFTVFGNERYPEDDWAPYVQSTVVYGRCHMISDDAVKEEKLRQLAGKYYPDSQSIEETLQRSKNAARIFEITIEHLSGKQVHEK